MFSKFADILFDNVPFDIISKTRLSHFRSTPIKMKQKRIRCTCLSSWRTFHVGQLNYYEMFIVFMFYNIFYTEKIILNIFRNHVL